jgi:acetolactate synthase I/II/III large subunit
MGFGLLAVIGAKVAAPKNTVVDIDGDASFSMTAMELATTSQFNISVLILSSNGSKVPSPIITMNVRATHSTPSDLFYDARYSHTKMTKPRPLTLARAMGVHAAVPKNFWPK